MTPDVPPDEEPGSAPLRPAVVTLFKFFCVIMLFMGLFSAAFGCFVLVFNPPNPGPARTENIMIACVYLVPGALSFFLYLVGLFLPRRRWGWTFSLVLLGLSMLACCPLPASIPLLIFYLKPHVKEYYGVTELPM